MKKTRTLQKLVFFFVAVLLLITPASVVAQSGSNNPFTIVADAVEEVYPAVAYNSQAQEYLVVWFNDRPGCDDIRARRISKAGKLLGAPFFISAECPANRQYPDVTYNSAHQQYLVVWESYEESSGYSIKGRRVSGMGVVLDAADISIRDAGYNLYSPGKPAVSYASTSDRYLVIWQETWHPMPIAYGIYGQVVTDAGGLEGSEFTISQGTDSREEADLVYNHRANRYLVVWQQQAGVLWDVHAQQVHGGGGTFQGDITVAFYTVSSTNPSVAVLPWAPDSFRFMVVWELHYAASDWDITGRLLGEDGSFGPEVGITADSYHDTQPVAVGIDEKMEFAVVYRHSVGGLNNPLRKQSVSYDGYLVELPEDVWGVGADHPAVANGYRTDFLVVWQDQPLGYNDMNIYGHLFDHRIFLPITQRNAR